MNIMKSRTVLLLAVCYVCLLWHAHAQVIVANPSVRASSLSKSELHDIFDGSALTFSNGSKAIPATLKAGPTHEIFLKTYVGKSDTAFRATWRQAVFSGQASMPKSFETETALLEYVASTPGAIGYVSNASGHDNVKVLTVH
jgi:ABC-type phosphate transport system substrate-binding protein